MPCFEDRLARAAARAGLPGGRVRPAGPAATALAETLAGRALLLCAEPFARQHGAHWTALADRTLHRGYDVSASPGRTGTEGVPGWLAGPIASAAGAVPRRSGGPGPGAAGDDVPARLAARG
ncbi:hypothetical protein [Streptomyces rameus]|uniref:hypothetical protein n=1 Tax=Streptomyces rameus TaxID=68261 RepID=UPI0031EA8272